jgi:hypothetical protein
MRIFLVMLAVFSIFPAYAGRPTTEWNLNRHVFLTAGNVLLTGASVSAGVGVHPLSVMFKYLKDENKNTGVERIAISGANSDRYINEVLAKDTSGINTVMALDFFFWDFRKKANECGGSLNNVELFLEWAKKNKTNLILGNIPTVPGDVASCAGQINQAIRLKCVIENNCHALNFHELNLKVEAQGYYLAPHPDSGVPTKYTQKDIRPDGLHFSEDGARIVAEEILRLLD